MPGIALSLLLVLGLVTACESSSKQSTNVAPPKAKAGESSSDRDQSPPPGDEPADSRDQEPEEEQLPEEDDDLPTESPTDVGSVDSQTPSPNAGDTTTSPLPPNTTPSGGAGNDVYSNGGGSTTAHQQRLGNWQGTSDKLSEVLGLTAVDVGPLPKGE